MVGDCDATATGAVATVVVASGVKAGAIETNAFNAVVVFAFDAAVAAVVAVVVELALLAGAFPTGGVKPEAPVAKN